VHVLQHQTRREVLILLRDGEHTAGQISEKLRRGRPTLSHHLSILCEAGLVKCRSQAAFRYYRIEPKSALAAWDAYLSQAERKESGEIV